MQLAANADAEAVDHVSETYRPNQSIGSAYRKVGLFLLVSLLLAIIVLSITILVLNSVTQGLVFSVLIAALIFGCFYGRKRQLAESMIEREITLRGGTVFFARGSDRESFELARGCWFSGKTTDDQSLLCTALRQRALILVAPSGRTIACGLSKSARDQWLSAFRHFRCRRVLRQESFLIGGLFLLLMIAGFFAGSWIGWQAGRLLNDLFPRAVIVQFENVLPGFLATFAAGVGVLAPWFIPGWRRFTTSEREAFDQATYLVPLKFGLFGGGIMTGSWVAGILAAGCLIVPFWLAARYGIPTEQVEA